MGLGLLNTEGAILVTGGAGYIGSHVVQQLVEAGESVVVLDNLSNGTEEAVTGAELIVGDILDYSLLRSIFLARKVSTVLHFAACAVVSESVTNPGKYYRNNVGGSANLIQCAASNGVTGFVFSSTAAVYGVPESGLCDESSSTNPINPYGRSKLMAEDILRDVSEATSMRHVVLRYFNAAGADSGGRLGQRGKESTHITKVACEAAVGRREYVPIYGTNYPTADGTCVRDYIHVEDLASAHVAAVSYLREGGKSVTLNCGYGHGYSVRNVVDAVGKANGEQLTIREEDRRPGDPPTLVAKTDRIRETLKWQPKFDDLDVIAASALVWERSLCEHCVT